MRRAPNPHSPEEVRAAIQALSQGTDTHALDYDHDTYDTAYGWGDHGAAGYLLADGTVDLTGNLAVDAAVTIDGRDISVDGAAFDVLAADYVDKVTFWNGTIQEPFDALVTEAGGVVTMSLEPTAGAGDLTMQFSDGNTTLDCTPAATIELTPGTDAAPTANFVFIPKATKVLTVDTDWPHGTEHTKIGYFLVPSAAFVGDHGVYVNQNWNDMLAGVDLTGHLTHVTTKLRHLGASWESGVDPNGGTASYYTLGVGATDWISTAGVIEQLHHQDFAVVDTTGAGIVIVKNWYGASYTHIDNLFDIVADSADGAITNNKYFNLVFWGVCNKSGEFVAIMVNLPSGIYTVEVDATTDNRDYSDFSIPREFNVDSGTAFLICRTTFKMGATWTHIETEDLRGLQPSNTAGGIGISDHGSLGGLADDDHTDYHTDARAATWLAGAHETTYDHAHYDTAYGWGDHAGVYDPAGTMATHEATYSHANYNTAYGWGDHAGVYVPIANDGKVKVDSGATGDYLGAAAGDGALRVSTGLSYADGGNFVTLTTNDGEIAHDSLSGYDANDHIDHTTITFSAGVGLSGGGTLAANRSFALDINGLATDTIAGGDSIAFHDDTGSHVNKTTFANFEAALDHGGLLGLGDDDHTDYHTDGRAATWLAGAHETTYNHATYDTAVGWGDHTGVYVPIANDGKVKVDSGATGDYIGNAFNDGALRTGTGISFADGGNFITLTTNDGEIAHDSLSGYDANKHVDHTGVTLTAGSGLTGGGTIAANRTFDLDINGLDADTIVAADTIAFYDDGGTHNNKTTFSNFNAALDHGGLLGLGDDDHTDYHTDGRAATWLAANHETTYNHALLGATLSVGDDEVIELGATPDYWFIYNSTNTRFEFWTSDNDGGGTDGIVWRCIDGTNDIKVYGAFAADDGIYGLKAAGYGVRGTSTSSIGVYGTSTSGAGVRGHSASDYGVIGSSVDSIGVYGTSTDGRAAYFVRDTAAPGAFEVVRVDQDNATDTNPALVIQQHGAGDVFRIYDGAVLVCAFEDGGSIAVTGNMVITSAAAVVAVSGTSVSGDAIYGTSSAGICGNFYRNVTTPAGSPVVFNVHQDNAADSSVVARIQGDGSGDVLALYAGASNFARFDNTGEITFTGRVNCGTGLGATYGVKGSSAGTTHDDGGVYGYNSSSGPAIFCQSDSGNGINAYGNHGRAALLYRNNASPSTGDEVVRIEQDNSSDSSVALVIQQDGTGHILEMFDAAASVAFFEDTGVLQTAGYKSSDGTAGATATPDSSVSGRQLNFKNGLYVGYTDP